MPLAQQVLLGFGGNSASSGSVVLNGMTLGVNPRPFTWPANSVITSVTGAFSGTLSGRVDTFIGDSPTNATHADLVVNSASFPETFSSPFTLLSSDPSFTSMLFNSSVWLNASPQSLYVIANQEVSPPATGGAWPADFLLDLTINYITSP